MKKNKEESMLGMWNQQRINNNNNRRNLGLLNLIKFQTQLTTFKLSKSKKKIKTKINNKMTINNNEKNILLLEFKKLFYYGNEFIIYIFFFHQIVNCILYKLKIYISHYYKKYHNQNIN